MLYRRLPKGEEEISILGIGTSSIQASSEKEIEEIVVTAIENGINFFDMASSEAKPFAAYGRAMAGVRDKVYVQIHFGANYKTGTYGWTTSLDTVKRSIDWQLKELKTDYIDFGFIHCIDESADLHEVEKNGIIHYIEELKDQGVVRHISLSSHTPELVNEVLDKPGVLTALTGVRNKADLDRILGFCHASSEEKDYSILGSFAPQDATGKCVYCNHCRPCPAGLDIGLINKYYDLAKAGDLLAKSHYANLAVKADACIQCGHCNKRCPFHVDQMKRMQEIVDYFK